jgi:NADH-quinone oxidoreductase subunit I
MAYKVPRREITFAERLYLPAILKGMSLTIRHFFRTMVGGGVTVRYPEKRRKIEPGWRGLHQLKKRPDGGPKCVGCELCSAVCPSKAIKVVAGDGDAPGVEKQCDRYEIDLLRCIFCGMCVEACPKDAITMTRIYELADKNRDCFLAERDALLAVEDKE